MSENNKTHSAEFDNLLREQKKLAKKGKIQK